MSSQRDEEEIRKRLTAFADTIPDHGLNAFGQLVEIEAVRCDCVYRVTLETDYEERTLLKREKPDDGSIAGLTDQAAVGSEVNVWDATWDTLVANKQPGSFEYPVPGATKSTRCGPCVGHGAIRCETCRGGGRLKCTRCREGCETCSACGGSGHIRRTREAQVWTKCELCLVWGKDFNCRRCGGNFFYPKSVDEVHTEPCARCSARGRYRCTVCDGDEAVNCGQCQGGGRLLCPTCQGSKRVVSWLAIQQTIKRQTETARCGSTGLTEEDRRHLAPPPSGQADELDQADYDVALGCEVPSPGSECLPPELDQCAFPPELRAGVEGLLAAVNGKDGHGRRIIRQSLRIEEAKVFALTYRYAGKEYQCKLVGKTRTLAETNPLTELVQARQHVLALKTKLRKVDSNAWLESPGPAKNVGIILAGMALLSCVLVLPIGNCLAWWLAWTLLASGWGLLVSYIILAACLYPFVADKKKVQEWVDKQNAPLAAEIRAKEAEVERLLQPDRDHREELKRRFSLSWRKSPEWQKIQKGFEADLDDFLTQQRLAVERWRLAKEREAKGTATDTGDRDSQPPERGADGEENPKGGEGV